MSRLAVDYPLLQRLGGKAPETDRFKFLQAFETYNTATIVNLQYEDKIVQVAAVYPNWSPLIEPVKYFQLKYVQAAMMESRAEFRIMAGDLNTRPSSCNYFMLGGVQLSPKECDEMTQPFIESMSRSKGRVIKFQEVCAEEAIGYPLELKSAFAGEGEERKVVVGERTLVAIEPYSTTTTCVFEDTLDSQLNIILSLITSTINLSRSNYYYQYKLEIIIIFVLQQFFSIILKTISKVVFRVRISFSSNYKVYCNVILMLYQSKNILSILYLVNSTLMNSNFTQRSLTYIQISRTLDPSQAAQNLESYLLH
ncbi:Endonuclease/Exonuclease/phosphatase_family protein [Hexamita inflata]|uniref:Endonuclease/Exonuclease/phosphatase family protein n=1 Tax=Hexamita inflata TaxID=28002 RepID=A0AA86PN29_9EUKA|nr:Endonuclease/Exonuclease/phosphatase family protein [Hexamita inflata]